MNKYKRNFFLTGGLVVALILLAFVAVANSDRGFFFGLFGHVGRNFCVSPATWETFASAWAQEESREGAENAALALTMDKLEDQCTRQSANHCLRPKVCAQKNGRVTESSAEISGCGQKYIGIGNEGDYFWQCTAFGHADCAADCFWQGRAKK